jgi:hypothetical protein
MLRDVRKMCVQLTLAKFRAEMIDFGEVGLTALGARDVGEPVSRLHLFAHMARAALFFLRLLF